LIQKSIRSDSIVVYFILELLYGDFCNTIGTSRQFAETQHFGRFRSEADIDEPRLQKADL